MFKVYMLLTRQSDFLNSLVNFAWPDTEETKYEKHTRIERESEMHTWAQQERMKRVRARTNETISIDSNASRARTNEQTNKETNQCMQQKE